ncbi:MAG: redoxin domain-containing protein [Planctomycetaceae bacterium]
MRELVGLAEAKGEFARLGAVVVALAIEPVERLRDLQARLGDGVTLLSDPDGKVAQAYGVLDPKPFPSRPMARSATFLLDRGGLLLRSFFPPSYRISPSLQELLGSLRGGSK